MPCALVLEEFVSPGESSSPWVAVVRVPLGCAPFRAFHSLFVGEETLGVLRPMLTGCT